MDDTEQHMKEFHTGDLILQVPAEFLHEVWHIPLKELPFDQYYISKMKCRCCRFEEFTAWPALTNNTFPEHHCANCNAQESITYQDYQHGQTVFDPDADP